MEGGLSSSRKALATFVLACSFSLETLDDAAFTGMYLALSTGLDITLAAVGALSMWRGLLQALITPLVGVAGNIFNRMHLIAAGTALSAVMYIGLGSATSGAQAVLYCAGNGIGLAFLLPTIQSVISEMYAAKQRGKAFGFLLTTAALGGVMCSILAVTYSRSTISSHLGQIQGWRGVFFALAGAFAGVSLLVPLLGVEPRSLARATLKAPVITGQSRWLGQQIGEMTACLGTVFRIRTFLAILAVNSVWVVCNGGVGFMVVYFQLLGFSTPVLAALVVCWRLGIAAGNFLGGALGDAAAARLPGCGRALVPQLGMLAATPLCIILFCAMPGNAAHGISAPGSQDQFAPHYGALLFAINAFSVWHCPNTASMYAEVVPKQLRTSVYAVDKAVNVALYAVSGPLAAALASGVFGFADPPRGLAAAAAVGPAGNAAAAVALEHALLFLLVVPRVAIVFLMVIPYFTLVRDQAAAAEGVHGKAHECKADMSDEECAYVAAGRNVVSMLGEDSSPFSAGAYGLITGGCMRQALSKSSHVVVVALSK
ncbi:g4313 [Coccomyxa elongata]